MGKSNNLDDFLTDLANTIREKKGTNEPINAQDFSSEIASIQSGGDIFGFDRIGYTLANADFAKDIEYSIEVKNKWESGEITTFQNDTNIRFLPLVSKEITTLRGCSSLQIIPKGLNFKPTANSFYGCSSLLGIPDDIPFADITTVANMFYECNNMKALVINAPNAKSLNSMCRGCRNLTKLIITHSPQATHFTQAFHSCVILCYLSSLDFSSATNMSAMINGSPLNYLLIENIGKSTLATYDFSGASVWGVANDEIPDARQSLIDSLITYSYDRASNGMATATIKLSATTKALLTEEEIAQITNKGFTIS